MDPPSPLVTAFRTALDAKSSRNLHARATGKAIMPARRSPSAPPATQLRMHSRPEQLATRVPVALLGAGDYARTHIIPALESAGLSLFAVADREPQIVTQVATRHGVPVMTTRATEAIDALPPGGLAVVATAHDSHAEQAGTSLERGLWVFVEKPPVVTEGDLRLLVSQCKVAPDRLEVGFNRRYHPFSRRARTMLASEPGPTTVVCTVKEIPLAGHHWYFWPNQGTRVTGNLCHWIDLAVFLMGSGRSPVDIALSPPVAQTYDDERALSVTFDDGSFLTLIATNRGDESLGVQEVIIARRGQLTIMIDDYRYLRVSRRGHTHGHSALAGATRDTSECTLRRSIASVRSRPSYPLRDLVSVSSIQIVASKLMQQSTTTSCAREQLRALAAISV